MRAPVALFCLAAAACGAPEDAPAPPPADATTDVLDRGPAPGALTGRVWMTTDSAAAPGSFLVFLDDGTLLMDSCFETYRLAAWRMESDSSVAWTEDGKDIRATILSADSNSLRLRLDLVGGPEERAWTAATPPFVCPDMPR